LDARRILRILVASVGTAQANKRPSGHWPKRAPCPRSAKPPSPPASTQSSAPKSNCISPPNTAREARDTETTEYDLLFDSTRTGTDDLESVRDCFRSASRPLLSSPWSWLGWAVLLPAAALATPFALRRFGFSGVLFTWSAVILLEGAVEILNIRRGQQSGRSTLAAWVLPLQGNLSIVALLLSALLIWQDVAWALPGLWLLLLGHSFYMLGGFAFEPFRVCGLVYQVGGVLALWPRGSPLVVFAVATAIGNLWIAIGVWRTRRT
jgi:hypothetical protein